jgi:NlpE N-terminal domain
MKNLLITLALVTCCLSANAQTPPISERVGGIPGLYKGMLPCSDCYCVDVMLLLQGESPFFTGSYFMREHNRDGKNTEQWNKRRGNWHIVHAGTSTDRHRLLIALDWQTPDKATYFLLNKDGNLVPLDKDQKEITSKTLDVTFKKH